MTAFAHLATGSWSDFEAVAARIAGPDEDPAARSRDLQDAWQDLLRSAGQFDAARTAALAWTQREPESGRAMQRLGEVSYLSGALRRCRGSVRRARRRCSPDRRSLTRTRRTIFGVYPAEYAVWARLQQAAALQRLDRDDQAEQVLREAADGAARIRIEDSYWTAYVAMHAQSQLGMLATRRQDWPAAADRFRQAVSIGERHEEILDIGDDPITTEHLGQAGMLHGAQENNLALAYVKLGRAEEAIPVAMKALVRDPASPIFLDTVAFALHAAGRTSRGGTPLPRGAAARTRRRTPRPTISPCCWPIAATPPGHARCWRRRSAQSPTTRSAGTTWAFSGRTTGRSPGTSGRRARSAGPPCWIRGCAAPTPHCGPTG